MINLELSPRDREIIAEAHRQALVYRAYAPKFDVTQDHTISTDIIFHVPEEKTFPHVRNMARAAQKEGGVSGFDILSSQIYLEESWAAKVCYFRGTDADMLDYGISQKLVRAIGTEEQYAHWAANAKGIAWGMTEPVGGADPHALKSTARWDEKTQEWVINGEKIFISFAHASNSVIVMARATGRGLNDVITPFLVARDAKGFTLGPQMEKLGLRQWDTTSMVFQDVRVPDANRLCGNLKNAMEQFNTTRGFIAAQAMGYAKAALDTVRESLAAQGIKVDYAAPLSDRPAVVDRFIKLEELYESAWLTLVNAMWRKGNTPIGQDTHYPTLAKIVCTGAVRKITRGCIDLLGHDATSKSHFVEQAMRDSRVFDIYEGPGDALRLFIARWILGFKKSELN